MAKWFGRRAFTLGAGAPVISFSFDDFPRSALYTGGAILERFGATATYYCSIGIAGQQTPTGEIFHPDDLQRVLERGHELGCHTYEHCPAWETKPSAFMASVRRNAEALSRLAPASTCRTLSYPISYPRPLTKRMVARHFACCRGGGQVANHGIVDLNYLSAFFLEQSRDHPAVVEHAIDANLAAGGWLIFATHDVCPHPTRFGCTPEFFEHVARYACESGATILPVYRALQHIARRRAG